MDISETLIGHQYGHLQSPSPPVRRQTAPEVPIDHQHGHQHDDSQPDKYYWTADDRTLPAPCAPDYHSPPHAEPQAWKSVPSIPAHTLQNKYKC